MSLKLSLSASLLAAGLISLAPSHGATLFSENAEGGNLDQWTGQYGGPHQGIIVQDPLRPGNHVITFTGLNLGGALFSSQPIHLPDGQKFRVSFEYLGLPFPNSVPDDTGGFFGMSEDLPGNHMWYYGTSTLFSSPTYSDMLVDDETWHSYTYEFTPPVYGLNNHLRLMFEDWVGSAGVPGDAYFDNIVLESVVPGIIPESSTWLTGLAMGGAVLGVCWRRRLQQQAGVSRQS